jgi:hypothetical protein
MAEVVEDGEHVELVPAFMYCYHSIKVCFDSHSFSESYHYAMTEAGYFGRVARLLRHQEEFEDIQTIPQSCVLYVVGPNKRDEFLLHTVSDNENSLSYHQTLHPY